MSTLDVVALSSKWKAASAERAYDKLLYDWYGIMPGPSGPIPPDLNTLFIILLDNAPFAGDKLSNIPALNGYI